MVDENKITTAEDALRKRAQNRDPHQAGPEAGINVGFSPKGMQTVCHYSYLSIFGQGYIDADVYFYLAEMVFQGRPRKRKHSHEPPVLRWSRHAGP